MCFPLNARWTTGLCNSELAVVGWSNVASGLLGGFTGSYIFSQTVFTCRSGAHSRVVGAVVAASARTASFPPSV